MRSKIAFLLAGCLMLLAGCARMGNPDGGWYDDTPPHVVSASPADRATGVTARKITINFSEFIKLDDAVNKVVVSPPQQEVPEIKAAGKKIVVKLIDSLKPNTTYTIDFSDAISDNNEGNPMGTYTYTFSTGTEIDTFEVSGYVLNAENLEPIKGIMVGLYDDLSDTVFTSQPLQRVGRTDSRGRYVIKGVKQGTYRVYALQDADGDNFFNQKSEAIAFSHDSVKPFVRPDVRQDTIWRDSLHIDSIRQVNYLHYFPDDFTLLAFQEVQTDRYLLKVDRTDERKLVAFFTYGSDTLPRLRGLNFNADSAFVVEPSAKRDTITYWLRDTTLVNRDSLNIELTYLKTDTTGLLVSQTDTIEAVPKISFERREKMRLKDLEKWEKEQEKRKKRGEPYDSIQPKEPLTPKFLTPSAINPDGAIRMEWPTPLVKCDTAAIHLYVRIDSLWYQARHEVHPVEDSMRQYEVIAEWRPESEYSLEIDSAAFVGIYGAVSDSISHPVRVKSLDEYATLVVNLSGLPPMPNDSACVVVELLNASDAPVRRQKAEGNSVEFFYVDQGKYFLRAFVDANRNGVWDTGLYSADQQAEAVYYCPDAIECKARWDLTHSWNLTARPRHLQKPGAITKQKPEKEKQLHNRNAERAQQLGIPYNP